MISILHALIFASVVFASTTPDIVPLATSSNEYAKERVYEEYKDIPELIDVARCESTFRQFTDDGSVLRGKKNPKDVGLMQINEYWHLDEAEKLGIDIYTVDGNLKFGRYLYDKYGLQPWSASSPCWSK